MASVAHVHRAGKCFYSAPNHCNGAQRARQCHGYSLLLLPGGPKACSLYQEGYCTFLKKKPWAHFTLDALNM